MMSTRVSKPWYWYVFQTLKIVYWKTWKITPKQMGDLSLFSFSPLNWKTYGSTTYFLNIGNTELDAFALKLVSIFSTACSLAKITLQLILFCYFVIFPENYGLDINAFKPGTFKQIPQKKFPSKVFQGNYLDFEIQK